MSIQAHKAVGRRGTTGIARRTPAGANVHRTAQLGDLIVAAFDEAAGYSTDPKQVSHLATQAVFQMLRHAP